MHQHRILSSQRAKKIRRFILRMSINSVVFALYVMALGNSAADDDVIMHGAVSN